MATFTVTSTADNATDTGIGTQNADGSYSGTLREAINFANQNVGNPSVSTTINTLAGLTGTITLAGNLPLVATSIQFDGGGLTLDGASTYRGFLVAGIAANGTASAPVTVGFADLTIQNVVARGGAGASGGGGGLGAGGAVFVGPQANVTLNNVDVLTAKAAGGSGGSAGFNGGGGGLGGSASSGGGGSLFFNGGFNAGGGLTSAGTSTSGGSGLTGPGGSDGGSGADETGQSGTDGGSGASGTGGGGGSGGAGASGTPGSNGYRGGNGGSGGSGGVGGFGGGGGRGGSGGSSDGGNFGPGGPGGAGGFGGGGGGGGTSSGYAPGGPGGAGGFGGGGGSSGSFLEGGQGGFGGGGGAGAGNSGNPGGSSGFAGGAGGTDANGGGGGGGGGGALGGAIFVAATGSLTINGAALEIGSSVTAGAAGGNGAAGSAYDAGIFFEGGTGTAQTLTFGTGNQIYADAIGDLNGAAGNTTTANGLGGTGGILAVAKTGGGTLNLQAANTYTGGTTIDDGTIVLGAAGAAGSGAIDFAASGTASATLVLTAASQTTNGFFANTLNDFGTNETLDLAAFTYSAATTVSYSGGTLDVSSGSTNELFRLTNATPDSMGQFYAHSDGAGGTRIDNVAVVCFASGTLICTARGDVAVEHLAVGDIAVTASGEYRLIRWIGHRVTDCRRHARSWEVMPVRIAAHAFAENRPARDLLVSPGHALCVGVVGEVLIMAASLINGTTITQDDVDHVTYWHVELEGGHDILLAENMPAESYLDMGNRAFFAENGVVALNAAPDVAVPTHEDFCRPFHMDGPLVDVVRTQLTARARTLGWQLKEQGLSDLHLLVDGERVDPQLRGFVARFAMPATARDVWLVSPTSVPAAVSEYPDRRQVGACLRGLDIDDGFGTVQAIAVDDPRLCVGFHEIEGDGATTWRWTAGRARLPASLWVGLEGEFFLRVKLAGPMLPRWVAPTTAMRSEKRLALAG